MRPNLSWARNIQPLTSWFSTLTDRIVFKCLKCQILFTKKIAQKGITRWGHFLGLLEQCFWLYRLHSWNNLIILALKVNWQCRSSFQHILKGLPRPRGRGGGRTWHLMFFVCFLSLTKALDHSAAAPTKPMPVTHSNHVFEMNFRLIIESMMNWKGYVLSRCKILLKAKSFHAESGPLKLDWFDLTKSTESNAKQCQAEICWAATCSYSSSTRF